MDSSRINKLRGILESRRDSLSERVQNRNAIAIENAADVMDEVRLAEERDLATRILERDFTDIRLVDAALVRIEDGTYGFCLRCDETISWNRLRVMPDAAFCVNCQEAAERDGANVFSLTKASPEHLRHSESHFCKGAQLACEISAFDLCANQ